MCVCQWFVWVLLQAEYKLIQADTHTHTQTQRGREREKTLSLPQQVTDKEKQVIDKENTSNRLTLDSAARARASESRTQRVVYWVVSSEGGARVCVLRALCFALRCVLRSLLCFYALLAFACFACITYAVTIYVRAHTRMCTRLTSLCEQFT